MEKNKSRPDASKMVLEGNELDLFEEEEVILFSQHRLMHRFIYMKCTMIGLPSVLVSLCYVSTTIVENISAVNLRGE